MGNDDRVITYGNIKLISPYTIKYIEELKIVKRVNTHSLLLLTGIVPEETQDSFVEKATAQDPIEVIETADDGSTARTLFKGIVSNIGIKCVRGIYTIEIEALSCSCALDIKMKNRSFQNKGMVYKDLINKVIQDYPGADFKDYASKGAALGEFTLQYNETDWGFLKRMASRFGAVLIPDTTSDKPKFWFGLHGEKEQSIPEDYHFTVTKDIEGFLKLSENNVEGIGDSDFIYYKAESRSFMDLGYKVNFKGKNLVVAESQAIMKDGLLKFEYSMVPEKGLKQKRFENSQLSGASIEGKVIDTQKDNVKVHLNIDDGQSVGEAYWFRYTTSYTAEGNSGWYCMPQKGDAVKLYFPNALDDSAVVVSSVRKGGQSHPKTANPSIKYFGTDRGKEMKLGEKDLVFTVNEGQMVITLDENKGIDISCEKSIMMGSEKDLSLDAKNINMSANECLYLSASNSGSMVILDGEANVKAGTVLVEGTIKAPMSLGDIFNMVKDTVMMPVEAAVGVAGMVAFVGNAAKEGKLGEASMAVASNLPVVAGAKIVANDVTGTPNDPSERTGQGRLGLRGANL